MKGTSVTARPQPRSSEREPLVVKPATAARMLDCSRADIYNRIARGELRRSPLGNSRSVRIPIEDVYALAGIEYNGDAA